MSRRVRDGRPAVLRAACVPELLKHRSRCRSAGLLSLPAGAGLYCGVDGVTLGTSA